MFPFRPSRAATALLELAEAMLAPQASADPTEDDASVDHALSVGHDRAFPLASHPHRRAPAVDRCRRPAPPRPEQTCLTPLTRAAGAREALRAYTNR